MRLRPAILFTTAYGAGLATGLLHFGAPLVVVLVTAVAAVLVRQPSATLLISAALLGRLSGELAWLREAQVCAARLPAARLRLFVRLLEPADSTGGLVAVQPVHAGCSGSVSGALAGRASDGRGSHRSGDRPVDSAARRGRASLWHPRRHGGKGQCWTPESSGPGFERHCHAAAGPCMASARRWWTRSFWVGAAASTVTLQDRFAQSGLVHLLSISGFHVGVITAWVFLLCRMLRLRRGRALALAAGASVGYVAFLGWPAPATRAAALAVLLAVSRVRQRQVETNSLLSATCLCVLLVDPWAVLDLGAWLSAAALWGATTFSQWTDRTLGEAPWWRTLGSSVGATLATAPITATTLGAVAVIGIVLNFLAIPLAAVAVPGVLASLLVFPLSAGAGRVSGGWRWAGSLTCWSCWPPRALPFRVVTSSSPRSSAPRFPGSSRLAREPLVHR